MKTIALADMKDNFSRYLREAGKEKILITRHGRPAGILVGFETEDDWFDYRLESDPRFLARIARARRDIRKGKAIPWEQVKAEDDRRSAASTLAPRPRRARRQW